MTTGRHTGAPRLPRMYTALVSAGASTSSGFSFTNLLALLVLLAIGWPLFQRLRRSVSEKRKRRWMEEGLMDRPASDPEAKDPSD